MEFTYNNSFHTSIGMAPYEALYGRKCRTPLCWYETGESILLGPDIIQRTTEEVKSARMQLRQHAKKAKILR